MDLKVAGPDRYKYFKRPLVPYVVNDLQQAIPSAAEDYQQMGILSQHETPNGYMASHYPPQQQQLQHTDRAMQRAMPTNFDYNATNNSYYNDGEYPNQNAGSKSEEDEEDYEGYVRDAWTQSDYRENEAQTEPFTPEYIVSHDEPNPEVLEMTELTFNDGRNGGQIGMEELKIIDKVRRRRKVEQELPLGTEKDAFDQRVKMLKQLEMEEWNEREVEIEEEQKEQLEMIRAILERREHEKEERNRERVESRRLMLEQRVSSKMKKFDERKQKEIRKIAKKYDNPEMRLNKRDVLLEYTFFGSKTYAPPPREGRITDLNPIAYEIRPALLTDPIGIDQVERKQIAKMMTSKGTQMEKSVRTPNEQPANSKERKVLEVHKHIENARRQIEMEKNRVDLRAEKIQALHEIYKAPPKIVRPPTPNLYDSDDEMSQEEDVHNSAILLQKLLRGRAVQCEFDEGKERSLALIRELQGVEEAKERERAAKRRLEMMRPAAEGRAQKESATTTTVVDYTSPRTVSLVVDAIQGRLISNALDYLAKEFIRAREMERIQQWAERAERERYRRVHEEFEARIVEERERKAREERFNLTISIYNETSDAYLHDILHEAVLAHARQKAMAKVQQITEETRTRTRHMDDEEEIREVVALFLIPQVQRELLRQKAEVEQAKVVKAIHDTLANVPV